MTNKIMVLSDEETKVLEDICFTRHITLESPIVSVSNQLSKTSAKQLLIELNFFESCFTNNSDAVKRQLLSHENINSSNIDCSKIIEIYIKTINSLKQKHKYNFDYIHRLHDRIKTFVKGIKGKPPRIMYISDCHFFHARLCKDMDRRGFSGYEEMNAYMIHQWNNKVSSKDTVYVLGDFCISKPDIAAKVLKQLNGKLHLILGNHDRYQNNKNYELFRSINSYLEIHDNSRHVILSHYPIFCYNGQYRKDKLGRPLSYMLYGHLHNTYDELLVNEFIIKTRSTMVKSRHADTLEPIPCNMINCFCMFNNYQPATLDEWIEIDSRRRQNLIEKSKKN